MTQGTVWKYVRRQEEVKSWSELFQSPEDQHAAEERLGAYTWLTVRFHFSLVECLCRLRGREGTLGEDFELRMVARGAWEVLSR